MGFGFKPDVLINWSLVAGQKFGYAVFRPPQLFGVRPVDEGVHRFYRGRVACGDREVQIQHDGSEGQEFGEQQEVKWIRLRRAEEDAAGALAHRQRFRASGDRVVFGVGHLRVD